VKFYGVSFGRLKTPGLREAAHYYQKLIKPWVSLEEVELKPLLVPEKKSALRLQIQDQEAQILRDWISPRAKGQTRVILFDEAGKAKSTQDWVDSIEAWENQSVNSVFFCLGSSLGFSAHLKQTAHGLWSFGPQTFSHELARVVLFEQIYRSLSVLRGHPYHNSD
jgi:23S rRNA (pseudouridine1915-N3)-methyltransferase